MGTETMTVHMGGGPLSRGRQWVLLSAVSCCIALGALALTPPALAAKAALAAATASEAITTFHKELIGALRNTDGKGFEARRKAVAPAVTSIFDAAFMAKYAVGDSLKNFSDDQQKELVSSFRDMMVASYASRFKRYNGQRFEVLSEGPINQQCDRLRVRFSEMGSKQPPKECALVKSQLVKSNGETRNINYVVYRAANSPWKIVDVLSGPASELATRRSEFSAVARNQGPDALIDTVKDKVIKLAQDTSAEPASAIP
jgi:phospholipid transport system substrate-binding protein